MIIRTLDFETTGLPSEDGTGEKHGIMESGWCDFDLANKHISPPVNELVNPGRPCSIEARAVHHISDKDVADGISPTDACMILMGVKPRPLFTEVDGSGGTCEPRPDFFCAHNIDHEKHFFGGGEIPWLCTYKAALRVWPDAPGHKLQELRYFLNIDDEPDFIADYAAFPHRAPDDAYVTAFVLRRMIADMLAAEFKAEADAVAKIKHWSGGRALLHMCWMKKHKGKPWSEVVRVDPDYMLWIWNESDVKDRDILATVRYHLQLHNMLPKPSRSPSPQQEQQHEA